MPFSASVGGSLQSFETTDDLMSALTKKTSIDDLFSELKIDPQNFASDEQKAQFTIALAFLSHNLATPDYVRREIQGCGLPLPHVIKNQDGTYNVTSNQKGCAINFHGRLNEQNGMPTDGKLIVNYDGFSYDGSLVSGHLHNRDKALDDPLLANKHEAAVNDSASIKTTSSQANPAPTTRQREGAYRLCSAQNSRFSGH